MPTHSESNTKSVLFRCLDRQADIEKTARRLPHWLQIGSAVFVTFRTADSMPRQVVERFKSELERWLVRNNLPRELAEKRDCELVFKTSKVATIVPNCEQSNVGNKRGERVQPKFAKSESAKRIPQMLQTLEDLENCVPAHGINRLTVAMAHGF